VLDQERKKSVLSIEGQSSFNILLWGIYGIAALLGSVFLYFITAQFSPSEQVDNVFIFDNNEGFVAALTLLIIVVSGAAVPIYTDLAKQVRQQIDAFELQISDLHRAVVRIAKNANPLWSHFFSVSQAANLNWRPTRDQVEKGAHDLFFKPFFQLPDVLGDGRALDEATDDELRRVQDNEVRVRYNSPFLPETKLPGFRASYLKTPNLMESKRRIRNDQLFKVNHSDNDGIEQSTRERGDELAFSDRLQRNRRLRYLGWMAQGDLARAVADNGQVTFTLQPITSSQEPCALVINHQPDQRLNYEDLNIPRFLVPASEDFMVAVLKQSVNFDPGSSNEQEKLATEYRDRALRHTKKWSTSLNTTLGEACDALDLDSGPFADDVDLLNQLTTKKDEYQEGTLARFFFYGHWLNALADPKSRISELLSVLQSTPSPRPAVERRQVSDWNDIRKQLTSLTQQVRRFVISNEPSRDLISDGLLDFSALPEERLLVVLAHRLRFSKTWLDEVRLFDRDDFNPHQRTFVKWIVSVLGTPADQSRVQGIPDEELKSLALRLIDPRIQRRHEQLQHPENELPDLTEGEFQAQFDAIMNRVVSYCQDNAHATDLQNTFFGGNNPASIRQAATRYEDWKRLPAHPGNHGVLSDQNLTAEFLLLTLADHKSALYNWMRAARAVEIRERVAEFQRALARHRSQPKRQLGVEVVPSRHDRLEHLRGYLGLIGHQKPLEVRSIYDLQPTPVERSVLNPQMGRDRVYVPYIHLVNLLDISDSWADDVAIPEIIQDWVYQREYQAGEGRIPIDNLTDRLNRFLRWIVRVLETPGGPTNLEDITTENLLLLALRLINPRTQRRHEHLQPAENELPDLTEEEFQAQFDAIMDRIIAYCQDNAHATDLQNTFFAGNNPASAHQAATRYEEWYNNFNSVE
jgi:hypothetical protein